MIRTYYNDDKIMCPGCDAFIGTGALFLKARLPKTTHCHRCGLPYSVGDELLPAIMGENANIVIMECQRKSQNPIALTRFIRKCTVIGIAIEWYLPQKGKRVGV